MPRARRNRSPLLRGARAGFVPLSSSLFAEVLLGVDISPALALFFIGSVACLCTGLAYFLVDIFASLQAMKTELLEASRRKGADQS